MYKRFTMFVLGLTALLQAQEFRISRYFNFSFSEQVSYSSNVLLADDNEGNRAEDISFTSSFTVNHVEKRRFFSYSLDYNFAYTDFLLNDNFDFDSHRLSAQFSLVRKHYTILLGNNLQISSELETLEFNDFITTYQNNLTIANFINISPVLTANFSSSYQIVRLPDFNDNDRDIFNFSSGISYRINERVSWNTRVSYTVVAGEEVQVFPGIDLGLQINSQLPNVYWLNSANFDFGYAANNDFNVPVLFNFGFSGSIDKKTSWNISAARSLSFSIIEDAQLQTDINATIFYNLNEYISPNLQISFQHVDLQDQNSFVGTTLSTSYNYSFHNLCSFGLSYSFSTRDDGENTFVSHNINFSFTSSF